MQKNAIQILSSLAERAEVSTAKRASIFLAEMLTKCIEDRMLYKIKFHLVFKEKKHHHRFSVILLRFGLELDAKFLDSIYIDLSLQKTKSFSDVG